MKKLAKLGIVFIFLTAFSHTAAAGQQVTIVGDTDYPPYCFDNKGKPDGIYVKIIEKIFLQMDGYDIKLELHPWRRALDMVKEGTAFAIVPPYYRPNQRPWINPYSDPIMREENVTFCNKTVLSQKRELFPDDFYGLKFGNNLGFVVGDDAFFAAVADGHIRLEEAQGTDTNLKKLMAGRVDCYINDRQAILWTLKQLSSDGVIKVYPGQVVEVGVIGGENGYLGFSRKVDATDFVAKFNAILATMQANGEVDKIVNQFSR